MALTYGYFALLVLVGLGRLVELGISKRHQRALGAQSARLLPEPGFRWMVVLHTSILVGSGLEVWFCKAPWVPAVAVPAFLLFCAANALRWWVMHTMAGHWNVRVVDSLALGVVRDGPFRFIRHPNYAAVFVELLALPSIHGAWWTAGIGALLHALVLRRRIALEEAMLFRNPAYGEAFAAKPRFVPRLGDLAR